MLRSFFMFATGIWTACIAACGTFGIDDIGVGGAAENGSSGSLHGARDASIDSANVDAKLPGEADAAGPPDCYATSPSDRLEDCVTETTGVFVAPNGSDSAPGTRTEPYATIGKAIATLQPESEPRRFIFLESGDYAGPVVISGRSLSLFGGFKENFSMHVNDAPAQLSGAGLVLSYPNVRSPLRIEDVRVASGASNEAGSSSLGALFVAYADESSTPSLVGIRFDVGTSSARAGAPGALIGADLTCGLTAQNPTGCVCPSGVNVSGGAGHGAYGDGGQGDNGGKGAVLVCTGALSNGEDGFSSSTQPAMDATIHGTLTDKGWTPAAGGPSTAAEDGSGGGGGAGVAFSTPGGNGGAGGCGGRAGGGGAGGGASIALLLDGVPATFTDSAFRASDAGDGGSGTPGEAGQSGGIGSPGASTTGCSSGKTGAGKNGGRGGDSGPSGGGAGGISAGVIYRGAKPALHGSLLSHGAPGNAAASAVAGVSGDLLLLSDDAISVVSP